MENLKVRVNNEAESREVQELFFELGYKFSMVDFCEDYNSVQVFNDGSGSLFKDHDTCEHKELTIQQLRDLAVLKRNDVGDSTHVNLVTGSKVLQQGDKNYYWQLGEWHLYPCGVDLKPIEKEIKMKEYLEKQADGSYELVLAYRKEGNDWIEVPGGAEIAIQHSNTDKIFFWKDDGITNWHDKKLNSGEYEWLSCNDNLLLTASEFLKEWDDCSVIIWKRSETEKQAEACENKPFSQCIPVPESAWDKQTGGDHYKKLAIQPMEYALKNKLDYAQANVVKYVTRHADKNGKEDLLKAIHNIELMIEHYYGNS